MSIYSFFRSLEPGEKLPQHPQRIPRYAVPIGSAALKNIFAQCEDFEQRQIWPGGAAPDQGVWACWLDGLVDGRRLSDELLRPLTDPQRLPAGETPDQSIERLLRGAAWACSVQRCDTMDQLVEALTGGSCAVIFDAARAAVSFELRSSNARSISPPTVEKTVKGGKDAFVEVLRTNTALVRRRLHDAALKLQQLTVGRKSATSVGIMYVDGVADPATVAELRRRLEAIDIDGLTASGNLEAYLVDHPNSPFPQLLHTERPDRFAADLLAGRVGLLVDGLPLGFLLPATVSAFMKVSEDRAQHFFLASGLMLVRWLSMLISLLFPALLVAVSMYHQEMIPTKLLLSMIAAKQKVPFSVAVEVLTMLVAFELLMEAGIRLPDPVGDTVSIIGALIVGQSAVEAQVVSPITVIVVATTAICGFTQPSRDMGGALRIFRFMMVLLSIFFGLFGISVGLALLVWYLCTMETFGVPYTAPLSEGGLRDALAALFQPPLPMQKRRERALHTPDQRNQK